MPIHGFPGGVISSTAVTPSVNSASGVWTLDEQLQAGANWPLSPTFLSNSVRTRSSATAYMTRTPATSGNRKTWTFSAWVKRGGATFNTQSTILHAYDGSAGQRGEIYFDSSNRINFYRGSASGSTEGAIYTNAVFRDPASWYHIVVVADFTNPTVANRGLIYVNGVLQSVTTVNAFASTDGQINGNWAHQIAIQGTSSNPFDGYLADVNFIDGQALTPNYFGATDAATGVWEPANYKGTYGTNGFYLPMNIEVLQKSFTRSLRFRRSANASLSRTPSVASNRKTWTFSAWIKLGSIGVSQGIFEGYGGSGISTSFAYNSTFNLQLYSAPTYNTVWSTTAVYRDPAAWYHVVCVLDTTQASQANMAKLYVNGVQQTFSFTNYNSAIPQNSDWFVNTTVSQKIGVYDNGNTLDGYLAEVNFVDGLALTPDYFGQIDTTSGAWQPVGYTGQYGTNGFYLPFTNTTSVAALGFDASGLNNNWTVNNISLTAGATYDSMTDVPTLTSATESNYAVLNPLNTSAPAYIKNGNLFIDAIGGTSYVVSNSTIGVDTGKWYCEYTIGATYGSYYPSIGVTTIASSQNVAGDGADGGVGYFKNGEKLQGGSFSAYGSSFTTGDVIGVALDLDSGTKTATFYKNNTSQGAITVTGATFWINAATQGTATANINFGQQPFAYTPPTGFVALNAFNM
jgi:hypothetical protein